MKGQVSKAVRVELIQAVRNSALCNRSSSQSKIIEMCFEFSKPEGFGQQGNPRMSRGEVERSLVGPAGGQDHRHRWK